MTHVCERHISGQEVKPVYGLKGIAGKPSALEGTQQELYIYIPQGHNCSHVAGCVGTMALPCITTLVTGRLQWLEELVCTQDWLTPAGTTCDLRLPLSLS